MQKDIQNMYVHVIERIMQGRDKSISLSRNLIEDRSNLSKCVAVNL